LHGGDPAETAKVAQEFCAADEIVTAVKTSLSVAQPAH